MYEKARKYSLKSKRSRKIPIPNEYREFFFPPVLFQDRYLIGVQQDIERQILFGRQILTFQILDIMDEESGWKNLFKVPVSNSMNIMTNWQYHSGLLKFSNNSFIMLLTLGNIFEIKYPFTDHKIHFKELCHENVNIRND